MTMVPMLRHPKRRLRQSRMRAAGTLTMLTLAILVLASVGQATRLFAQQPPVHFLHRGILSPGAIGRQQLQRGGPLTGYVQPVEIRGPAGSRISLAEGGTFERPQASPRTVGMFISPVYRLKVTGIPRNEGREVFPTIEIIDRLYPPRGLEMKFSIPVQITLNELEMAIAGKFVTRVIYLEDPDKALPHVQDGNNQTWMEIGSDEDPLEVADRLGRPMAILRLGGRVPDARGPTPQFMFDSPTWIRFNTTGQDKADNGKSNDHVASLFSSGAQQITARPISQRLSTSRTQMRRLR